MIPRFPPNFIRRGEIITATKLSQIAEAASQAGLQAGQFQNESLSITARCAGRPPSPASALRWGTPTEEIPAATAWGTWGAGDWQEYDEDGATVGDPIEVENWYPTTFAEGSVVCVDTSFSPPRVVSASCEVMPE